MNAWQTPLALFAVVVALLSYPDWRALRWIILGVLDFAATAVYQAYPLSFVPHPAVTFLVDGLVALTIARYAIYRWEIWVGRVFRASVCISLAALLTMIWVPYADVRYIYVSLLEACCWAALLIIGWTGLAEWAGALSNLGTGGGGALRRSRDFLCTPRASLSNPTRH